MSTLWTKAKEMELEAVKYYNALADDAGSTEVAGAFRTIAEEEKKHAALFAKLEADTPLSDFKAQTWDPKSLFENLAKASGVSASLEKAKEAYRTAISVEEENARYYELLLPQVTNNADRTAVEFIIKEEKKHARIFANLVEFIERPETWVENAEFNIMEEF